MAATDYYKKFTGKEAQQIAGPDVTELVYKGDTIITTYRFDGQTYKSIVREGEPIEGPYCIDEKGSDRIEIFN